MDKILILDFGSQTTQLIGRRIRESGVYTDIIPGDLPFSQIKLDNVKGIIFSGSPAGVYEEDAPVPDPAIYQAGLPILGICYGLQRMVHDHGGKVEPGIKKEYGRSKVFFKEDSPLFADVPEGFISWMSHGDHVSKAAEGFSVLAETENHLFAMIKADKKDFYGIQFHPEVSHCEYGNQILKNFTQKICQAKPEWTMEHFIKLESDKIRQKVGSQSVLLLISGGVDSTVCAALLLKCLQPQQIHLMYIDTGLMRKAETEEVSKNLKALGAKNLYIIDAKDRFLSALEGVSDPEEKRKIIGNRFLEVQQQELAKLGIAEDFLAQGTLYTDMIESGKGVGKKAKVIKSHHNVGTPLVDAKRKAGLLIEPLSLLYKDEVRALGLKLGVDPKVVHRHPFPGPGLAVRIPGTITPEKVHILQEADFIYIEELRKRNLYDEIWQAFSVLLPVRSVGVTGDARKYGYVLALRAVISSDGMTADVYPFPTKDLLEISSLITNSVAEIGRVVYDVSSKPPSTIEWE